MRGHAYVRVYVRTCGVQCALVVSRGRTAPTTRIRGAYVHIHMRVHALFAWSITTRVGTCTLHHVYVRVRMVSASVKHALDATVLA